MIEDYYDDYLTSDHWRKTRAAALKRAWNKCERCGATNSLTVHHIVYRKWRERPEDLQVLCWRCHKLAHAGEHKDVEEMLDYPEEWII